MLVIVLRIGAIPNDDARWCLTLAGKVLDGQSLYVDVIEVNPPATMFLYLVPAWLERVSGFSGEFFVDALVFFAAALSLWLSARILRPTAMSGG